MEQFSSPREPTTLDCEKPCAVPSYDESRITVAATSSRRAQVLLAMPLPQTSIQRRHITATVTRREATLEACPLASKLSGTRKAKTPGGWGGGGRRGRAASGTPTTFLSRRVLEVRASHPCSYLLRVLRSSL